MSIAMFFTSPESVMDHHDDAYIMMPAQFLSEINMLEASSGLIFGLRESGRSPPLCLCEHDGWGRGDGLHCGDGECTTLTQRS